MPDRYYLTTSIAYANNKPGIHTLYEVIGADVVARWYRMMGVETRFLTGTDEHSINIAQAAIDAGRSPRDFVDEQVGYFKAAEDALGISADRFIRTTDPDHVEAAREMIRRAYAAGDIYLGTYEGWYCPNEGFLNATDVQETARGTICPNHPDVPLQWLTERNWFFRLSAYQERLERHFADHPDFVQPDYRRNEMLGFIRGGLQDFSISRERTPGNWGIPFPIAENGETAQREDGSWDPEAGVIYVWYDALINYITGAGFPGDPESFAKWWPADVHVIGKDIARFHSIFWPAMLWSAGLEAPRHVWVHGFLMAAHGERMSKSRGNFLDPGDFVAAFGSDGARYVVLREVPFDKDAEVSWDSFVRRYNADLANDFGNLVNRTVSMANRYLDGERPGPGLATLEAVWSGAIARVPDRPGGLPAPRGPRRAVGVRRGGEPARRRGEAVGARQGRQGGRCRGRGAPARRPGRSRGGLPAHRPRRRAVPAGDGAADPGPARLRVPVRGRRQRRAADPRRAGVGRPRGRGGPGRRSGAALPAPGCRFARFRGLLTAPMRLVDSHCHLQADAFDDDVDLVIGGARLAGVERILVPGWNPASCRGALALADRFPWLDVAVGIHPHDASNVDDSAWDEITALAADPRVVAIGETGLDYDRVFSPILEQLQNLRRNLRLAVETGKPAILHCRSAEGERDGQDALAEGAPGVRERATARLDPLLLRPTRLRRGDARTGCGGQLLGAGLPGGGGGVGRRCATRAAGPDPGRDRLTVPLAARSAAPAERAGMGGRDRALGRRAPGRR